MPVSVSVAHTYTCDRCMHSVKNTFEKQEDMERQGWWLGNDGPPCYDPYVLCPDCNEQRLTY